MGKSTLYYVIYVLLYWWPGNTKSTDIDSMSLGLFIFLKPFYRAIAASGSKAFVMKRLITK